MEPSSCTGQRALPACGARACSRRRSSIPSYDIIVPGITTQAIDDHVRQMTLDAGALPATLGYRGFTHSCCTSINHVVCHGIPGSKRLQEGDIVNVDVTSIVDGWHGDTNRT